MLHRLFLAIVVACSLMGVDAGYRTQDCNGCLNAHAIKVDKYVGYSSAPSQSETQKSTKSSKSSINQDQGISVDIPGFQLTLTLQNPNADKASLDSEISDIVQDYLVYMEGYPKPLSASLSRSKDSIVDITSSTIVCTFTGKVTVDEYYEGTTPEEIQTMIETNFGLYEYWFRRFIESESESFAIESDQDFELVFIVFDPDESAGGPVGDDVDVDVGVGVDDQTKTYELDNFPESEGTTSDDGNATNVADAGNMYQNDSATNETTVINNTVLNETSNLLGTSAILGSAALIASIALFSYAYRRRHSVSGYTLSGDHENDLESQATPDEEHAVGVMKSLGLSDIAATTPAHSGKSYLGVAAKAWSATRRSMSDLAAGATQEEFFNNGMNIHVYGSHEKKQRKKQGNTKKTSPKGSEMELLEAIIEVDSLNSGTNADTESWQNGNKEINNAPPLLPALSISSAPSDETPLNDIRNMVDEFASPAPPSEDFDISFNTPGIDAMTPYADTTGVTGSPNITKSSDSSDDTPLHTMRCLSFDAARSVSDFSASDESSGSCVKDMLEAIDPKNSESSSDGCVKDMLSVIDNCAPEESDDLQPVDGQSIQQDDDSKPQEESIDLADSDDEKNPEKEPKGESSIHDIGIDSKVQEESMDLTYSDDEKSPEKKPKEDSSIQDISFVESKLQEESIDLTYSDDEKSPEKQPKGESSLKDIGLEEIDVFCPPEIKTVEGKMVMNDQVSGTSTSTGENFNLSCPLNEDNLEEDESGIEITSAGLSDTESITSLITVENKQTWE